MKPRWREGIMNLSAPPPLRFMVAAVLIVSVLAIARWVRARSAERESRRALLPTGDRALELFVPHAQGAVVLDGDQDDPGWRGETGRTGAFVSSDGVTAARPYSQGRFVWGDGYLYVSLYAADQDIRARHETADGPVWLDDSFHMVFSDGSTEHSFDLSPLGTLTDGERKADAGPPGARRPFDYRWNSGAHVSHELDGTPNNPADEDEEWLIEMAIPFEALGMKGEPGERIGLQMKRCDVLKSGQRLCGTWGGDNQRGVLILK
jgi:hypothetical protein